MIGMGAALVFCCASAPLEGPKAGPADVVRSADDAEKLREQIARGMQTAQRKLKDQDAGDETRNLQKQILADLDRLLEQAKNPPTPSDSKPMGSSSQKDDSAPMSSGSQTQSQSQPSGGMSRRERREAQRRQEQLTRGGQPKAKGSGSGMPGNSLPPGDRMPARTGPPESLADVVKDIWGQLPDTLRQEVDHYYREQFMPRYRDLLQQYYSRMAETERPPREMKR
jgi:hypothetical protein